MVGIKGATIDRFLNSLQFSLFNRASELTAVADDDRIPIGDLSADGEIKYITGAISRDDHFTLSAGDVTTQLQAVLTSIAAAEANTSRRIFVKGICTTTGLITYPDGLNGVEFYGSGADSFYHSHAATRDGAISALVWDGAAAGTMFDADGVLQQTFRNMNIVGRPTDADDRAGYFWKSVYTANGAGVSSFHNVLFEDFATVFKLGEGGTVGAADISFHKCGANDIDVFMETTNANAVNIVFDIFNANDVPCVLEMTAGGSVFAYDINFAGCGGTGADVWLFDLHTNDGANVAHFDGVRLEQDTKHFLRSENAHTVVTGLDEAQSSQAVALFSQIGGTLLISDSRLITHDATVPTFLLNSGQDGADGLLVLERVHFDVETWVFAEWFKWVDASQRNQIIMRDCTYGNAKKRLPNINSAPEHGVVTHFASSTSATAVKSTVTGSTTDAFYNRMRTQNDDCLWAFDYTAVGREVGGGADIGVFRRHAVVKNVAGTVSVVADVAIGTDVNTDTWGGPTLTVDTAREGFYASLVGKASTTISWTVNFVPCGTFPLT